LKATAYKVFFHHFVQITIEGAYTFSLAYRKV